MSRTPFHPGLDRPERPDGTVVDGPTARLTRMEDRLEGIEARLDGIEGAIREARWERWALAVGLLILMGRAFGVF